MTGSPVAGTSDPTPNGLQTVVMTAAQVGTFTSGITVSDFSACAVYKINETMGGGAKGTFTSNSTGGGAPAYFGNASGNAPQGLDVSSVANVGNGTATPTATWVDTCVSYNGTTGAFAFYRNGSTDGTGTNLQPFTKPVNQVFTNNTGELFFGTVAELDVMNTAITSTQAAAIHACAVSTYGAV